MKRTVRNVLDSCELLAEALFNVLLHQGKDMPPGDVAARMDYVIRARNHCHKLRIEERKARIKSRKPKGGAP